MKKINLFAIMIMAALTITFTSCEKVSSDVQDIEAFTSDVVSDMHGKKRGKRSCLKLVYPVSIQFIDESIVEVDSAQGLKEAIMLWFETNDVEKTKENKPQLVFPLQVTNKEGEVFDVNSQEELLTLRKECPKKGKRPCFKMVFPVTMNIGGEELTFDDKASLKGAIKAYKEANGPDAIRPTLVFPVTVQYKDGTQATANNEEELKALKEEC